MAERIAIVVVGMHRSGSSAMARLLSLAGATLPNGLMSAGEGNETGHWEPQSVADYNDTVLAAFDAAWDSPFGLGVNATRRAALAPFVEGARAIIRDEYGAASPIVLKEPRISLITDLWIEALEAEGFNCKFVITVRPPTEVAASLRKRNGFALDKGLLLWGAYLASAELLTRAHDRVFCRYDDVIVRPASVLDEIETKLRIELPRRTAKAHAEMDAFVRPALKHNDASTIPPIPNHLRPISELSDYLYASIVGEIPNTDISRDLLNWFSDLDQTITPLMIGIEQHLRREQESATAAGHAQVEAYRAETERVNALYHEQLADSRRLTAQFADIEALRRDAEQRSAAVEQAQLAMQACLDRRDAELAALNEAFGATNDALVDLSGTLERRTAELAELSADHQAKTAHIASMTAEADSARTEWQDREAALIRHANGLGDANEQAVHEYAASLALVEARHEEERAAQRVASQAREAELAAEVATSQDAARLADEAIAVLRDALAQTQEVAAARTTDLQQQMDFLRAADAERDAAAAETIATLTRVNEDMARTHADELAAMTVRADEREATLEQFATARELLQAEMAQRHETEAELRHSVAALMQAIEQRDATLASHVGQIESLIETIADLNRARVAQEEAFAAEALGFRNREEELQSALTDQINGRESDHAERKSIVHRLKALFDGPKAHGDVNSTFDVRG